MGIERHKMCRYAKENMERRKKTSATMDRTAGRGKRFAVNAELLQGARTSGGKNSIHLGETGTYPPKPLRRHWIEHQAWEETKSPEVWVYPCKTLRQSSWWSVAELGRKFTEYRNYCITHQPSRTMALEIGKPFVI